MKVPAVDTYDRSQMQGSVIKEYVDNQVTHILTKHPHLNREKLTTKVQSIVKAKIQRPKVRQIVHKSYGNAEYEDTDLLTFSTQQLPNRIITPFGTTYFLEEHKKSFVKSMISDRLGERGKFKNSALDHQAKGNIAQYRVEWNIQSRIKIGVNSISGAMGSAFNCLFDPAGYNAITSTCRHGCMTGYAHTERFFEGNFYFTSYEDVANWCVVLMRACPSKETIDDTIKTYKMIEPTTDDLVVQFAASLSLYTFDVPEAKMRELFDNIPQHQKTFIYYAYNLKNVFRRNDDTFKSYVKYLFELPNLSKVDENIDPKELFEIDEDLLIMVVSAFPKLLDGDLLYDTIKDAPHKTRKVITVCRAMAKKITELQQLFDVFMHPNVDIPNVNMQKNMMRKTVILSDTDSVIASTKSWVEWYSGEVNYSEGSYHINFLTIFLLTKSLTHIFAVMSANIGMKGADLRLIAMKNEFFYPIMLRTAIRKHYIGVIAIQEGRWLPKPKMDLKGKQFRGSDLSTTTLAFIEEFIKSTFEEFMENSKLYGGHLIRRILAFEHQIMDSIKAQEVTYFGTSPINPKEAYKKPEQTAYFYYMFWQEVFAEKYDDIHLPQKCRKIPLYPKVIRSKAFLENLEQQDPELCKRLVAFLEKWPRKNIAQFFFPLHIKLPEEIMPAIDTKHVVHNNVFPLYLILRSFGIGVLFKNRTMLFSDMYTYDKEESCGCLADTVTS